MGTVVKYPDMKYYFPFFVIALLFFAYPAHAQTNQFDLSDSSPSCEIANTLVDCETTDNTFSDNGNDTYTISASFDSTSESLNAVIHFPTLTVDQFDSLDYDIDVDFVGSNPCGLFYGYHSNDTNRNWVTNWIANVYDITTQNYSGSVSYTSSHLTNPDNTFALGLRCLEQSGLQETDITINSLIVNGTSLTDEELIISPTSDPEPEPEPEDETEDETESEPEPSEPTDTTIIDFALLTMMLLSIGVVTALTVKSLL